MTTLRRLDKADGGVMDSHFPWDKIEDAFVREGLDPKAIADTFGVPRLLLGQKVAEGGWRKKREDWLKTGAAAAALGVDAHELTADELVAIGRNLGAELKEAMGDVVKVKLVRSRAEAYRTLVEALNIATRLARDVRGIRLGAPSKPQEQEVTKVTYEVVVEPPKENGEAAAAS